MTLLVPEGKIFGKARSLISDDEFTAGLKVCIYRETCRLNIEANCAYSGAIRRAIVIYPRPRTCEALGLHRIICLVPRIGTPSPHVCLHCYRHNLVASSLHRNGFSVRSHGPWESSDSSCIDRVRDKLIGAGESILKTYC